MVLVVVLVLVIIVVLLVVLPIEGVEVLAVCGKVLINVTLFKSINNITVSVVATLSTITCRVTSDNIEDSGSITSKINTSQLTTTHTKHGSPCQLHIDVSIDDIVW